MGLRVPEVMMTLWNLANTGFTARLASKQLSCGQCQQCVRCGSVQGKGGSFLSKCSDQMALVTWSMGNM